MPRKSLKRKVLEELERLWIERMSSRVVSTVDSDSSSSSNSTIDNILDTVVEGSYNSLQQRRYVYRNTHRNGTKAYNIVERDLTEQTEDDDEPPWLTDDEFLEKYRLHRSSFWSLLDLIKDHPIFKRRKEKKQVNIHRYRSIYMPYNKLMIFL